MSNSKSEEGGKQKLSARCIVLTNFFFNGIHISGFFFFFVNFAFNPPGVWKLFLRGISIDIRNLHSGFARLCLESRWYFRLSYPLSERRANNAPRCKSEAFLFLSLFLFTQERIGVGNFCGERGFFVLEIPRYWAVFRWFFDELIRHFTPNFFEFLVIFRHQKLFFFNDSTTVDACF